MNLLTFATFLEAKETINAFKAKPISKNLYSFKKGEILITGVGMLQTIKEIAPLIHRYASIYHFGFAGSIDSTLLFGSVYEVASVEKGGIDKNNFWSKKAYPSFTIHPQGLLLKSFDYPIYHQNIDCDLVDMEGYAIAFISNSFNRPCKIFKVISDFCNNESSNIIKEKGDFLSKSLSAKVFELF